MSVDRLYHRLLSLFGPELFILRELSLDLLEARDYLLLALALKRMRTGEVSINPGYDGEYGVISVIQEKDFAKTPQLSLF
jgi:PHP family Zn ribbon phosphoesterase